MKSILEIDKLQQAGPRGPDVSDTDANASLVSMNEVILGSINRPNDVDVFRIDSLRGQNDGILTISIDAGHPGVEQRRFDPGFLGAGFMTGYITGINNGGASFDINGESTIGYNDGYAPLGNPSGAFNTQYDLTRVNAAQYYLFSIVGNSVQTGPYTLRISNPNVTSTGSNVSDNFEYYQVYNSKIDSFNIRNYLGRYLQTFYYENNYGSIGQHDPEEFLGVFSETNMSRAQAPYRLPVEWSWLKESGQIRSASCKILPWITKFCQWVDTITQANFQYRMYL